MIEPFHLIRRLQKRMHAAMLDGATPEDIAAWYDDLLDVAQQTLPAHQREYVRRLAAQHRSEILLRRS